MVLAMALSLLFFFVLVDASLPLVDFDRMGKVGLAGAFAGLDLFNNATVAFDPTTSSIFARATNGSLQRLASTNEGGRIIAGCALSDVFYFAGSFSSIAGTTAANIASYTPSSGAFTALGSGGPNGEIDAVFCDTKNTKLWVGGSFTSPGTSVAVWDPKPSSWSAPPFKGLAGAEGKVLSITTNSSDSSLFFAGSFVTSFVGNTSTVLNDTNNPNVPFSAGATPFTSSLVPVPIPASAITGSPSSSETGFTNASNILCPAGPDGAGNSWFGADANTAELTIRTFTFMTVSGVRLGNTFQPNHGTIGFVVTTIPDNTVQTLTYVDPTTNQNKTCSNPCPLLRDSSILYQDFLFSTGPQSITGVQIQLTEFTGDSSGLHILQLLSSGAFASAVASQNGPSCFSLVPSNVSFTGNWTEKDASTGIPGTEIAVLTSTVDVGTSSANGPTFTWNPYVSASGDYTMNMLIPGCTQLQDCPLRTSVKVTVFPGKDLDPWVTNVTQQNTADSTIVIYQGPILPTSPDFLTTVTMTLADDPVGSGQDGKWELVADRIQLVLDSVNANSNGSSNGSSVGTSATVNGFGFFEWPLASTSTVDGTTTLANTTETALDSIGSSLFSAVGGSSSLTSSSTTAVVAVAHHPSSIIFLGGDFTLSSGSASGSGNVVSFKDGALVTLTGNGLNGNVTSFVLDGDTLFVGGSFTDTQSASNSLLRGVASYNVQTNQWSPLSGGIDGSVSSLSLVNGQLQVAGSFTSLLSPTGTAGSAAAGFAVWDVASSQWVNSGGFIVGSMTLVANGTSDVPQFVAGNVEASQPFGASGLVMLKNSGSDQPSVTPLGVTLDADVSPAANQNSTSTSRRRSHSLRAAAWFSRVKLPAIFSRQTSTTLAVLPAALPAPAPAVLAGAFWTNSSSSAEVAVIGGNFSFFPSGSTTEAQGVAVYNPDTATSTALKGAQVNGTVRTLLVVGDILYVGGEFTISGLSANGFAIYNLATQQWDTSNIQALQGSSGTTVVVRSITASTSKANTIIVAGSFAQAGSLLCRAVCSLDTTSNQWNALGSGIQGDVASVAYAGSNQEYLIASGSIALSDSTAANVAQFTFSNASWVAVGSGSDLPGPVTAVEVNAGNASSIFAAGRSTDASSSFLSFWNGISWTTLSSTLESNTTVAQLAMVPLQDTHEANSIIQSDRMLMISGSLADPSFGNASSALFDGQNFFPYIVSTSFTGSAGTVSSLFHSFATFSFTQHHFLATGVVILISIAIAAGVVFLLSLIGILWTLFSRRDDKLNKMDGVEEDDDDSTHHRPSSLLEHINAATRTTIIGTSPFAAFSSTKEDKQRDTGSPTPDQDPFAPDASNYMRAETPSDAVGGIMTEEMSRPAQARYSFDGAGEGELPISAGSAVEVLDDRDPAWWYARDVKTGQEGVVPAAYLF